MGKSSWVFDPKHFEVIISCQGPFVDITIKCNLCSEGKQAVTSEDNSIPLEELIEIAIDHQMHGGKLVQ